MDYGDENEGEIIHEQDSSGTGETESFYVTAGTSGQYVIFVSSYGTGETGSYTLHYEVNQEEEDSGDDDDGDDDETCSYHSHPNGDGTYYWEEECY